MKRILSLILFCALSIAGALAQTVTGTVQDKTSGEPIAYATVRLFAAAQAGRPDAKAVKAVTTDLDGHFTLQAPQPGDYALAITYTGYTPLTQPVTLSEDETKRLGTLQMEENAHVLKGATVAAQRVLVKAEIDKISYSMEDDPDAQSSSLLDMLRKVPMVTVDGEDNIQVKGSSSFKVYVNGKPNQMLSANPSLILKNFPASAVKRVEVVTNPGAKYDAEGVAGVLNIVTEDATQTTGWTVTPTLKAGNKDQSASLLAMFQTGKFTLSAHYSIGHNRNPGIDIYSAVHNYADARSHLTRTAGSNDNSGIFQFGSLDASYEFTPKDLLSVNVGLMGYNGSVEGKTRTDVFTQPWYEAQTYGDLHVTELPVTVNGDLYAYVYDNNQRIKQTTLTASADYQHTFAHEGQNLTLSYRLSHNPTRNKLENIYTAFSLSALQSTLPDGLYDQRSDPRNRSTEHTFQVDYTHPFGQGGKDGTLSVGGKYILRLNNTNSLVETSHFTDINNKPAFAPDDTRSLEYDHRGDVAAAYAEYLYNIGKFGLQAGTRFEHYRMQAEYARTPEDNFTAGMSDVVPSLTLSYRLRPTMMLKAGYNMRIGRPGIGMLSPYHEWRSAEVVTYGNSTLKSERAHNFNVNFSSFAQRFSLNTTLGYAFGNNGLTQYSFMDNSLYSYPVYATTYCDLLHNRTLSLNVFMNWMFTKTTTLNVNASGEYKHLWANEPGILDSNEKGLHGTLFAGLVQQLPWKLRAQLWAGGSTRDVNLQGRTPSFHFYQLSLSRSFLREDRLTVTLSAGNFIDGKRTFGNRQDTPYYYSIANSRINLMSFGLSVQWRFGTLRTSVKKASRSIQNDDVIRESQVNDGTAVQSQGGM